MSGVRPDALVLKIVHHLQTRGEFVIRVPSTPLQGLVDVRWAIKAAAKLIDRRVEADERRAGDDMILTASLEHPSELSA